LKGPKRHRLIAWCTKEQRDMQQQTTCHNESHCAHDFASCENFTDTALPSWISAPSVAKIFAVMLLSSRNSRQIYVRVSRLLLYIVATSEKSELALGETNRTSSTLFDPLVPHARVFAMMQVDSPAMPFLRGISNCRIRERVKKDAFCFFLRAALFIHQQLTRISLLRRALLFFSVTELIPMPPWYSFQIAPPLHPLFLRKLTIYSRRESNAFKSAPRSKIRARARGAITLSAKHAIKLTSPLRGQRLLPLNDWYVRDTPFADRTGCDRGDIYATDSPRGYFFNYVRFAFYASPNERAIIPLRFSMTEHFARTVWLICIDTSRGVDDWFC